MGGGNDDALRVSYTCVIVIFIAIVIFIVITTITITMMVMMIISALGGREWAITWVMDDGKVAASTHSTKHTTHTQHKTHTTHTCTQYGLYRPIRDRKFNGYVKVPKLISPRTTLIYTNLVEKWKIIGHPRPLSLLILFSSLCLRILTAEQALLTHSIIIHWDQLQARGLWASCSETRPGCIPAFPIFLPPHALKEHTQRISPYPRALHLFLVPNSS